MILRLIAFEMYRCLIGTGPIRMGISKRISRNGILDVKDFMGD